MRAKLMWKVVHGPTPARAGTGHVHPGQRAVSLARLAHWGRYGPLWAAMGRYGPLWAAMGFYGPLWAAIGRSGPLWAALGRSGPLGPLRPAE